MIRSFTFFLLVATLGQTSPARANTLPVTLPVESLQEKIRQASKSASARKVVRAVAALEAGKHATAQSLAEPLQSNDTFADYGLWIAAASLQTEAADLNSRKQRTAALSRAQKALELYLKLQAQHPYSPLLEDLSSRITSTRLAVADAHAGKSQWSLAAAEYERVFQMTGSDRELSSISPLSLGFYARACKRKETKLCRSWIRRLASLHSRNSAEVKEIAKHASDWIENGKPSSVDKNESRRYRAPDQDATAFDEAMALYLKKDYGDAVEAFEKLLVDFPQSEHRYRARYWLGRSLDKDGENEKSQETFKALVKDAALTYYGFLASLETRIDLVSQFTGTVTAVTPIDSWLQPLEVFRIRRAEHLLAEEGRALAARELEGIRPRDALAPEFLMYLATLNHEAGNHTGAFIILGHLIARGYEGVFTNHGLELIFPTAHQKLLEKYATERGLDPILVMSLVKQESAFAASAVSWAGARGLMQLMPATARDMDPNVKPSDLVVAERNVSIGTQYLSRVLKRFDGNFVFALAGYNAGPNAVARWVREGKAEHGMLEFIEAIPYAETRGYVGSIIRNYYWYSRRLKGEASKTLETFWGKPERKSGEET